MVRHEFLTLAITETIVNTDKFNVITLNTKTQDIIPFHLHKNEIVLQDGTPIWDIGFTTIVEENPVRKNRSSNSPFILNNIAKLGDNKIDILKNILEAKALSANIFFENEKKDFCVLKADKLDDIFVVLPKDNDLAYTKHYLKIKTSAVPVYKNPISIRNKDYRWIHYWSWTLDNETFAQKKNKYLKLYNRKDKNLYLILYRHNFGSNSNYWITGMHWL